MAEKSAVSKYFNQKVTLGSGKPPRAKRPARFSRRTKVIAGVVAVVVAWAGWTTLTQKPVSAGQLCGDAVVAWTTANSRSSSVDSVKEWEAKLAKDAENFNDGANGQLLDDAGNYEKHMAAGDTLTAVNVDLPALFHDCGSR